MPSVKVCLLMLVIYLASFGAAKARLIRVGSPQSLENLFDFDAPDGPRLNKSLLEPIDLFLEDILPTWLDQAPNNQNGTRAEFKDYAMSDVSNDDAARLTGQELLLRSGFKYELYDAVAEDGYITQLTRVINPLADRSKLRQPPVLMEHGGTIDPTAYLLASSIQHFPEPWPRSPQDGPMRSWNRSLAFTLANNGFDVWLAETRGSNEQNKRHIRTPAIENFILGKLAVTNHTVLDQINEVLQSFDFWAFSQDDIIAHEFKSHIDSVLKASGASKLNLMTFSLSTPTSLAFLGERPDYAEKINAYVSMAPIISGQGTSTSTDLLFKVLCPMLPDEFGTILLAEVVLTKQFRDLLIILTKNKEMRYSLFKTVTTILMGPSPKWQTLLDLNLIGHLFRQLSFREVKQMCQQMLNNRLQKYDYGPVKNQLIYNQSEPPTYNISNLHIRDWIVVSGSNDALSTPQVIEHLLKIVNPKPSAHIVAPNFNHLDLFAGWENDIYVNRPIVNYFKRMSYVPPGRSGARELDLNDLVPEMMQPVRLIGQATNISKQLVPPVSPIDGRDVLENLAKSLKSFAESILGRFALKQQRDKEVKQQDVNGGSLKPEAKPTAKPEANAKNPIEKLIGVLKPPGADKLPKNISTLLNPRRMMDQVGGVFKDLSTGLGSGKRGGIPGGTGYDAGATTAMPTPIAGPLEAALGGGWLGSSPLKVVSEGGTPVGAGAEAMRDLLGPLGRGLAKRKSD